MKTYFSKSDRRLQTEALSLLAGLILCPLAGMATDSIYINNGTINNANIPQIDATNFYNSGSWNINTDTEDVGVPYETAHTLNYTNVGSMIGTLGWEFDYGPLPNGGRGMSANFVNNSAGASIQANNGPVENPIEVNNSSYLSHVDYLWVSATNLVNKGLLQADAYGEIRLVGTDVNISRSTLEIAPVPGNGSSNGSTNFTADLAVYDEYWGTASTNLDSSATWNGTNATSSSLPSVDVTNKCNTGITVNGGFLSFAPTKADSTNIVVGSILVTYTNAGGSTGSVLITTNIIHQAVFVLTSSNANITPAIGFTPSASPTNLFRTANVQLSNSASGGSVYLVDTLASDPARGLLPNSFISPLDECGAPTYRPTNYIVARTFGSLGSPGRTNVPANFLYDTNWGSRIVSAASYAAYSFLVDNGLSGQGVNGNLSFTNAAGRIYIYADVLNLDHAQLLQPAGPGVQGDGALIIQANQVVNSQTAIINFRNLSFNLGSTNGFLNVSNLATASSLSSGINGTVSEWSAVWTNQYNVVTTNYFVDTNIPPNVTPAFITNTVQVGLYAWLVDASQLQSSSPVTVYDLLLHSTNIVLSDTMTVANSFLLDGQSFTLLGNLTLSGLVQNWTYANAPNLLYFTNNGELFIPNDAHFGDDTAVPYVEFVNSGIIISGDQTIDSLDLQINNGINYTFTGDFSATARSIEITGPPTFGFAYSIYSANDINLSASTLLIDPSALFANGALNFNVTTNLSDNGAADSFTCYNGFNLWTKPATGDLLGTTITNIASGNFTEVDTAWAGEDRGPRWAGFSNNVAIGTLVLSPQNFTNTEYPLFYFYGTGVSNGMYMNTLDLSQFTSAAEVTASIQVASNLKMYFRSVNLGFTPPGSPTPTPEQFMATNFVGSMSQVPDIVVNQSGTVDWKTSYQRIDGFGGGVVFLSPGSLDPVASTNADTLFNTNNANQLGLTLLRIRIDPTTNWANALLDASNAVVRGARVLATPWTPPTGMKDNNNIVEGSLLPSQYSNYANYLNGFAAHMATNGAPLAAISIQNEPDANVNYESCVWTPAQLQAFCHTNASAITNAPVLMPESESYNTSYSDPTLDDPIAAANVSLIGGHLYGVNTIVDYPNAHNKGKPTWMTEYLVNDQTIGTAVATAQQIHDCLTVGNMSAYIWWKCLGDANGLVNASGVPQKRGFVMAQFSRFVRPGYYRFGVTNIGGALSVSAYRDTNSMNFAIVAVNTNANVDVTQTFYLTNFNAASVTPWMTSATNSLANLSSIPVTNSSFTYLIPAQSVVTFVGLGSGGVSPNIVISSTAYISSGPSFVLSWNATAGATYSVRKTNVLNGSSINWPAIVTNYPAGGAAGGPLSYTDTPATFGPAFYRVSSP